MTVEERLDHLEDMDEMTAGDLEMLSNRISALAEKVPSEGSFTKIGEIFWKGGYERANERLVHRLDALEVRLEELESARVAAV